MQYRSLGDTGFKVSEVGFGAWAIGGNVQGSINYGPTDDKTSKEALSRALDLGCTFFDTADYYGFGHSEELIGQLFGNRQDIVITTKVGLNFYRAPIGTEFNIRDIADFTPDHIRFACEASLKRLRRDAIDLYQLHLPSLEVLRAGDVFDVLDELKQAGKIRTYGVSIITPSEGLTAIRSGKPATVQVVYNMLQQEVAREIFPPAREGNVGIIARTPLFSGLITGKYKEDASFMKGDTRHRWTQDYIRTLAQAAQALRFLELPGQRSLAQAAIRFALESDAVSVVIPGIKTPEQAEENLRASDVPPLTQEEMERIQSIARAVRL